jgi:hypothetical protein
MPLEKHAGPRVMRTLEFMTAGSAFEALCAGAAVVLAILGLSDILPVYMAPIATICVGAALLGEGGVIIARLSRLLAREPSRVGEAELFGGAGAEFTGGIATIALGVLALIGLVPMVLLPAALIVASGSLLFGSGATSRINQVFPATFGEETNWAEVTRDSVMAAAGGQLLVGVGGVVLGILALLNFVPMTLVFAGLLSLGGAELLSGGALGSRMMSLLYH